MFADPEDEMKALIDGLDLDPGPVVNVQDLSTEVLIERFTETTEELKSRGEVMHPSTDAGRALHSQREAYLMEMRRRRLR